jgi:hypothetical protein
MDPFDLQNHATAPRKPLQLSFTRAEILQTLERVERALAERGMPAKPGTSLGMIFSRTRRYCMNAKALTDAEWLVEFPVAAEGQRIAHAIEVALDDPHAQATIRRITTSAVELSDPSRSPGKDALWELDLFRRLQLGGTGVRFGEPDLIVPLRHLGLDYSIACKKVYSPSAIKNALKSGVKQVQKSGRHGVVALSVDYLPPLALGHLTDDQALEETLKAINQHVLNSNLRLFSHAVGQGRCDGILICKAISVNIRTLNPPRQLCWSTLLWPGAAASSAKLRIEHFEMCVDAAISARTRVTE